MQKLADFGPCLFPASISKVSLLMRRMDDVDFTPHSHLALIDAADFESRARISSPASCAGLRQRHYHREVRIAENTPQRWPAFSLEQYRQGTYRRYFTSRRRREARDNARRRPAGQPTPTRSFSRLAFALRQPRFSFFGGTVIRMPPSLILFTRRHFAETYNTPPFTHHFLASIRRFSHISIIIYFFDDEAARHCH